MTTDSPHGPAGKDGTPGPPGEWRQPVDPRIGIPSPHSVTQIQVTQLRWEYLAGSEIMEHVEIWNNGQRIATSDRSIGITGACGSA